MSTFKPVDSLASGDVISYLPPGSTGELSHLSGRAKVVFSEYIPPLAPGYFGAYSLTLDHSTAGRISAYLPAGQIMEVVSEEGPSPVPSQSSGVEWLNSLERNTDRLSQGKAVQWLCNLSQNKEFTVCYRQ